MRLAFTKMHGLGNDFIVFDARGPDEVPSAAALRRLADRRTGIGFDQALVLSPPARPGTDVHYRIFNADGSEVEQCGNGARCIARLVASRAAIREMLGVLEELRNDDEIAVVLTTGAGDVAYCAGRDLSEFPTEGGKNRGTDRRAEPRAYHLAEALRTFPKVTIAVVNGFCLGGGITLLLPHDLAIASDKAQFGLPEIKRGFLPYPIIATMFKTLIPTKFAFEMILTGENWDAERSKAAGLINRIVPHAKLQDEAWKWGEEIGQFDKVTLKYCKMAAHSSMEAASVPLAAEIAWLMQEEHALVNPRAYAGTTQFHK